MYNAREIKDRVAIGDDKYTVIYLEDGRIQLIPAPDEVVEPGTDVNKGLLQQYEDWLEFLSEQPTYVEGTMLATGWEDDKYSFESTYPNSQYDIEIYPSNTCSNIQLEAFTAAVMAGSASINVATALGDVPNVDIPILLKVRRKEKED